MRLNLICAKDDLNRVFKYVKITKELMYSTNGHALGVIPTKMLFDDEFIKNIPDDGMLIHSEDYAKIITGITFDWKLKVDVIKVSTSKKSFLIEVESEKNIGNYPNVLAVIPKNESAELRVIGLDFKLANTLQEALVFTASKLTFNGEKGIYIEDASGKSENYGLLMPVNIKS